MRGVRGSTRPRRMRVRNLDERKTDTYGAVADDDVIRALPAAGDPLTTHEIVITEKADGGNCCLRDGKVYARTHNQEAGHGSFDWVKGFYQGFSYSPLLAGLGLYGENLQGIHSIEYSGLTSFFYLFGVRVEATGEWLAWDELRRLVDALYDETGIPIPLVPLVHRGAVPTHDALASLLASEAGKPSALGGVREGFVVRVAARIASADFERCVAKYVRKGHVQTGSDWRRTWKQATLVVAPAADAEGA